MPQNSEDAAVAGEPDPFADLVLDENFVRSATRYEPPARTRSALARFGSPDDPTSRKTARRQRAGRSGHGRTPSPSPRRWPGHRVVPVLGVVVLVSCVVAFLLDRLDGTPGAALPAVGRAGADAPHAQPGSVALEQEPELLRWRWTSGHCYTWDQRNTQTSVADVSCAGPHLFEAVGDLDLGRAYPVGRSFPGPEQWGAIASRHCDPLITPYLGYSLDPAGRFAAGTIHPLRSGWEAGTRRVVCGLIARSRNSDTSMPVFGGQVRGADQAFTYPAGTCFRLDGEGRDVEVDCAQPHHAQSVGPATLADIPGGEPPSQARFTELASAACGPLLDPYLRQPRFGGAVVNRGWQVLADESWRAGTRATTCTVRFSDAAGNPKEAVGVLTPAASTAPGTVAT
ncbi:septum formation family protein [Frankia sp. AgB32]|uniref:septum formation family protein n=1 Tax=Frankia sp. AgB32 TaxID=631119 RepID=UPI002010797A|nr:septum formation family protein [Frankia sp. AgB32]MCK9893560.1 septum formation family protein [Frankia sp. AgB32]